MDAAGGVCPAAVTERDAAALEVAEELGLLPLGAGRGSVFLAGQRSDDPDDDAGHSPLGRQRTYASRPPRLTSWLAMTLRWISLVPSPTIISGASRKYRSTSNSVE